jgi:hypothetical protein
MIRVYKSPLRAGLYWDSMSNRKMKVVKVMGPRQNPRNRNGNVRRNGGNISSHPPPISSQSVRSWKLRYIATGAVSNVGFNTGDFSNIIGQTALTTTTSAYLASDFRLRKVSMWGLVATAGTPVTTAIDWNTTQTSTLSSPGNARSDTSISFDHPAYVSAKPPRGSLSGMWQKVIQAGATQLCSLSYPVGTTIDFELDFLINDNGAPILGPALVAATAGEIYHSIVHSASPVFLNGI